MQLLQTLRIYDRRMREGKELMAALDFARYVLRSGIPNLLNEYGLDGAKLRWLAQEIVDEVQDRFRRNDTGANLHGSEVATIDHKLDLIAGQLSRLVASPSLSVRELPAPELRIVERGTS